ncbi:hypothetical protein JKF63_07462 [Porcisia hertigi]|uniref:Uncharacterized protein n=1 Tax=Porcisia hertigi TaxID=2761500 RepID=A0A836I1U0_9TRYP|nr:hypothetical protein JKF63_07462 [Porcisia hertigi]
MTYGTLVLCTIVLYAPHTVLAGVGLRWQPMLIVVGLLSSLVAFLPLFMTGLMFQALHWASVSDVATATWVVVTHFLLLNAARVGVLHVCLRLQRHGWDHGCLLVCSRFPLVTLSIAVGAGFAATSLLVSGGALLAEAWAVAGVLTSSKYTPSSSSDVAQGVDLIASSGSCAELPRFAQACFQQTFFTCGQVAWTVMMGQAYAALWPPCAAKDLLGHNMSGDDTEGITGGGSAATPRVLRSGLEDARLAVTEHLPGAEEWQQPLGGSELETVVCSARKVCLHTGVVSVPREEAEANQRVTGGAVHSESDHAGADPTPAATPSRSELMGCPTAEKCEQMTFSPSSSSEVAGCLVADSVLAQRLPTAVITGTAALALHAAFILLPLAAMDSTFGSARNTATPSSVSQRSVCIVSVPLQCVVTIVSVVWGLWIVHLERHPSAYMLLPSSLRLGVYQSM